MKTVRDARVRGAARAAVAVLFLLFALAAAPSPSARPDVARTAKAYAERATAEHSARTRFRRLEIASLVLILIAGGAAILWTVRRK